MGGSVKTEEFRRPGTKDKHDRRRDELARAALQTMAERGYADTSLRDIAESAGFTTGLVHYYFADRTALISRAVELYRAERAERVQDLGFAPADGAVDAPALVGRMLRTNAKWNRFFYDIRNQSRFEPYLRPVVEELTRERSGVAHAVASAWARAEGRRIKVDGATLYAVIDGLIEHALTEHLAGDAEAAQRVTDQVRDALYRLSE
jgi:AcrR family transcriptional regulator